ncbi:uncharacterized protein KGF55_004392 [Candida pseudojiufengensis]|uniref:uncharacterized protein n=1 Tax=Candida pseudojiufengensis TaxID=497109 RepID=UPI0022240FFA|nr:uncharacterized protein KGF55_004392 [Candida pseudojiufengensis]KAI5960822.1 hypothetical protein KGF55_004392 [Candida pseudojiufengensis]
MSQLFVDEDEDMDYKRGYKPSTTTIKEEELSDDEEMSFDDRINKNSLNLPNDDDEYQLPPTIPREQEQQQEDESEEEDDDPIIESIPLIINQVPKEQNKSLHLLQYPGRPKTRSLRNQTVISSIKPNSKYLELKLPLDVNKFFNKSKLEEWGENINLQNISGVMDQFGGGNYIGKIINNKENKENRKIVLIPLDSSVQLRSTFKYIDDLDKENLQNQRKLNSTTQEDVEKPSIQILQTAAKHSTNNQDGFNHSLGDSLKSIKKFDEEEWKILNFKSNLGDDNDTREFQNQLINGADGIILENQSNYDDYIDHLYK